MGLKDFFRRGKTSITEKDTWQYPSLVDFLSNMSSKKSVTEWRALQLSAVYACIRLISQTIGVLPLTLHQKQNNVSTVIDNALNKCLSIRANTNMTAYMFKQVMQAWVLMFGNAYAEKEFNNAGEVIGLWPIAPWNITVQVLGNEKFYIYKSESVNATFKQDQILHIPGMSFDGIQGYTPLKVMRQEVELSNALQTFGTKYFENGTNLGGIVEHPGHLGKNARDHLKEDLDKNYTGLDHAQRTIILEEGMKYNKIGIPAEDSQFIQSRKFQLEEVCRYYGVQLHMIQNLDKASFNNIEQQSLEFRTYCMLPWATIWEQEIYKSCLTPEEQLQNYYARYNMNALLRADYSTRMNNYRTGVQMGLYSLNEVREMEDMNPIPGDGGNVHFVNAAMIDINTQLTALQPAGTAEGTLSGVGGENDGE